MKYVLLVLIFVSVFPIGIQATEDRALLINSPEQAAPEGLYKESYALIIGVNDYTEGWPDLPGVEKDVEAVKTALEEQGFHVTIVKNPTRPQLDQAFTEFINQYGQIPENRLLFYFAGHGHTLTLAYGGEMGYIVPTEAPNPNQDKTGFLAKAMDMQMIEVYAKRIQAKHAIFLFDSCFSGAIFTLTRAIPESISYKTTQPVRQFLTAGSAEEQVPDESIFRRQFVAALEGEGDVNGDGYVTGTELGEFLQEKVVNYSRGSQHPQYGKIRDPNLDKGDFVFLLPGATFVSNEVIQVTPPPSTGVDPETEMWELIKNSQHAEDVQDFLTAFPNGKFASVARLKLKQLQRGPTPVPQPTAKPTAQPTAKPTATPTVYVSFAERYANIETANTAQYIGDNTWEWSAFIKADAETLAQISCVEYTLHPSFPNPVRLVCTRENNFALTTRGWGTFQLKLKVIYLDGSQRQLTHQLKFR